MKSVRRWWCKFSQYVTIWSSRVILPDLLGYFSLLVSICFTVQLSKISLNISDTYSITSTLSRFGFFSVNQTMEKSSVGSWALTIFTETYLFIYQLFWTQACSEGMWTNETQVPCEVPSLPNPTTRKGWPHLRGLRLLSGIGPFTSHKNKSVKVLWDGTYGFSSLSEKTRKSNHLQMSLQRQHFLLSYLKTLSVGPAGVWTRDLPLDRPAFSHWANKAVETLVGMVHPCALEYFGTKCNRHVFANTTGRFRAIRSFRSILFWTV